jgi:hypothetical protein
MRNYKPVVVNGNIVEDYFVSPDGEVWSTKGVNIKKLSKAKPSGKRKYPMVSIRINGRSKSIDVHRLVCASYHKFPKPNGITHAEWKSTPDKVQNLLKSLYQVNHIDHNHSNHHPSNLEWVTVKENSKKYQQHRVTK